MQRRHNTKIYYTPNSDISIKDINYSIEIKNDTLIVKEISKDKRMKKDEELNLKEKLNSKLLNPQKEINPLIRDTTQLNNQISNENEIDISTDWEIAGSKRLNLNEMDFYDVLDEI